MDSEQLQDIIFEKVSPLTELLEGKTKDEGLDIIFEAIINSCKMFSVENRIKLFASIQMNFDINTGEEL